MTNPPLCFSILAAALILTFSAHADVLTIDETTTSLRIDGHLDSWPEARMITLNQASQITEGKVFWKDEDDFSGRIFLTYDSQYLYVAAIVTKRGRPVNNEAKLSLWNGDCLEIFLTANPKWKSSHRPSSLAYHIGISPGTDCKNPQAWCLNKNCSIPTVRLVSRNTRKGYILEAGIPLSFFEGL